MPPADHSSEVVFLKAAEESALSIINSKNPNLLNQVVGEAMDVFSF